MSGDLRGFYTGLAGSRLSAALDRQFVSQYVNASWLAPPAGGNGGPDPLPGSTRSGDARIVGDDIYLIRAAVSAWIADPEINVIITTGGTGLTGRDGTPEAVAPLLDKLIDGFGELFRAISFAEIGTSSLQSRCIAGVANGTYVFCLPGSTNACVTAWEQLISDQLDARTRPCNLVDLIPRLLD
jgi:molybdenum cofactor biosynthesis protein B